MSTASDIIRLVASTADLSARSDDGLRTPLMIAAIDGDADAVQALLESGADRGTVDTDGKTAQQHAQDGGHIEAVRLFS